MAAIVLLIGGFFVVRYFEEQRDIDLYIQEAAEFASDGQYDQAIAVIKVGLKKHPDSADLKERLEKYSDAKTPSAPHSNSAGAVSSPSGVSTISAYHMEHFSVLIPEGWQASVPI